jgi:fermentation-respiration switch protein FrsA (DUF1100 family)
MVAVIGILLWVFQRRLVYFPTGDPGPPPAGWGSFTVTTDDGIDLTGWVMDRNGGSTAVVVFPGNAGNRADRLPLGRGLAGEGFAVILAEYRGYGGNEGSPTERGLAADARAVMAWARVRFPDRRLILFGESLGAAVAVGLATETPVDGLVLRSPFTSLSRAASANYFGLPLGALLWDDYPTINRIAAIGGPVTVIAGSDDSIIPASQSREVFDAASNPFEWMLIPGADHNDAELSFGRQVLDAVVRLGTNS